MKSKSASNSPRSTNGKQFKKAVVMGASIAGLWTARALSDYFEEVTVLERDQLPEGPEFRSGAPQIRQFHTLLQSGLEQMKAWFPGLAEELIAAGAVPYDVIGDVHARIRNRWLPRFPSGWVLLSCSRLLLEAGIRRRLRQNPCIHFVEGVEVVGLQSGTENRGVTGVRTRIRRGGSGTRESDSTYEADLIVDALGRRSRTPEWLVEMGYAAPTESEVDSFLGYVTRKYRRKAHMRMLLLGATPPHDPYAGLVFPEENDTVVAMFAGYNKNYPPTDPQAFDEFVTNIAPEVREILRDAEPLSQPYGYRGTSSRWRHYEQLERWPERFVVLGDAFCGFNPVYGQGMSVAAMSAVALADRIKKSHGNLDGVARSTLQEIGKITDAIWLLATSADLEWPGTVGGTVGNRPADRFVHWYIGEMLEAMEFDRQIRLAFIAVNQLVKPGNALFAPGIFLRVMKRALLKRLRRQD